jgi:ketosteroid isomerase-like protein
MSERSEANLALVQNIIDAAKRGEKDVVASHVSSDFLKVEPPTFPFGGVYRGTEQLAGLLEVLDDYMDTTGLVIDTIAANDDLVLTIGRVPLKNPRPGGPTDIEQVATWVIRDGKLAEQKVYAFDGDLFRR